MSKTGVPPAAEITTIGCGGVNAYLLAVGGGFVLVDTGKPERRGDLEARLRSAGCAPGDLRLIVLTHGDYDHAGNAAYLRDTFRAPIAVHADDAPRVETGDWQLGMKPRPDKFPVFFRAMSLFIRPGDFDVFTPDVRVRDGQTLATVHPATTAAIATGLDATVLHLPGHTAGSIGVLTAGGDLFCGDLLDSMFGGPSLEFFIDDMNAARASLARLRRLDTRTVYPGHGKPFRLAEVA